MFKVVDLWRYYLKNYNIMTVLNNLLIVGLLFWALSINLAGYSHG